MLGVSSLLISCRMSKLTYELKTEEKMQRLRPCTFWVIAASLFVSFFAIRESQAFSQDDVNRLLKYKSCIACDLSKADLSNKNLEFATVAFSNLKGARLNNSTLHGVNFFQADLTEAELIGARVEYAVFFNADLTRANITNWHTNDFTVFWNAKWIDGRGCAFVIGKCVTSGFQSPGFLINKPLRSY